MSKTSICIGKVVEISNASITVTLTEASHRPYKIINSIPVRVGGVGEFIRVNSDIYEIANVKTMLDTGTGNHLQADSRKILQCNLIGYFSGGVFHQGNSGNIPNVFDNVYTITDEELIAVYAGTTTESSIPAGKYLYADDLDFRIDVNKLYASHILIVGNTGSGKSNSLNTIYANLFRYIDTKDSYFLIVDTNGEYSDAFTRDKSVKCLDTYNQERSNIHIPINLLESEDWKLLLEATEKTQYPIIKKVWNDVRKYIFNRPDASIGTYICNRIKASLIGILNSSVYASNRLATINSIKEDISYMRGVAYLNLRSIFDCFDNVVVNNNRIVRIGGDVFTDVTPELVDAINNFTLTEELEEFSVYELGLLLNTEQLYRAFKYNVSESNTSPMIARFNSNKSQFSKIFTPYNIGNDTETIISSLFEDSHIVICDVSNASKDIRRIMVTFICGKLYRQFIEQGRGQKSLHLIVDEAHNYLSRQKIEGEDPIAKTCIETFESIIKEGRKFGVFLTMSTQRPSDITGTLLSQAHNYVIHKLVNPKDIDVIKNTVPFIDAKSISMLSILAPGQAIFSGTAFNRPNIIQVEYVQATEVNSQTIKLLDYWERRER